MSDKALPSLIGVTGRAQHGKDTIGAILGEVGYKRLSFADGVREVALAIDPLVAIDVLDDTHTESLRLSEVVGVHGWEVAKSWAEVRRLLQAIGTEGIRDIVDEDCWVKVLARKLDALPFDQKVVITDVRFPNEAQFLRQVGGEVWRVVRYNRVRGEGSDHFLEPFDNGLGTDHPSEAHVDSMYADLEVANDADIDHLRRKVIDHLYGRVAQDG